MNLRGLFISGLMTALVFAAFKLGLRRSGHGEVADLF